MVNGTSRPDLLLKPVAVSRPPLPRASLSCLPVRNSAPPRLARVYRLLRRANRENIARRKWRLVNWAAAEAATGFKKGKTRWVVRAHTARVGGRTNWLGKKIVTARTLILPDKRLPCGHFPICRFHGHDTVFGAESVHFSPTATSRRHGFVKRYGLVRDDRDEAPPVMAPFRRSPARPFAVLPHHRLGVLPLGSP